MPPTSRTLPQARQRRENPRQASRISAMQLGKRPEREQDPANSRTAHGHGEDHGEDLTHDPDSMRTARRHDHSQQPR